MLVSYNWLREFVEIEASPEELCHRLTMAGLEVSNLMCVGEELEHIQVAKIEEISPHPNADKLFLCRINDGKEIFRVVCGAQNMKTGDKVAFAPVGTLLPNGLKIKSSKIRGVISEGMLCSEEELKLEEKSMGIMILPSEVEIGKDLASALRFKDYVIEVEITPNRADCFSMIGIAREVAALYDTRIALPSSEVKEEERAVGEFVSVSIEAPELCTRYTARYVSSIKIKPSPIWMRRHLELAGIRSINNIVDVTNYILLEWGQPMHAFDYSLLDQGRIIVRKASSGETFYTLDNKEQILDEEILMIGDSSKNIAIGGVMGGLNTEITESTTSILLESACFNPQNIIKTSKKLGIKTESSLRFEKGVNPETVVTALNRAARLIAELAGGKVAGGVVDVYPNPKPTPPKVELRPYKVNLILGTEISKERMASYLERLEIHVESKSNEVLLATIPPYRGDLKEEVDLIEEIARIHGYEQIPFTLPHMSVPDKEGKLLFYQENKTRSLLADIGFFEVITYSFIAPEMIKALEVPEGHQFLSYLSIANPLSKDQSVMRTTLIPGLLMTVAANHNRKNMNLKIFELGRVFIQEEKVPLPNEKLLLSGLTCGLRNEEAWNYPQEEVDFYDLKGVLENIFRVLSIQGISFQAENSIPYFHPGISSQIVLEGIPVGVLGEILPHVLDNLGISKKIFVFEVDFGKIIHYGSKEKKNIKSLPKFPSVYRDIALIVDEAIESQTIEEVISSLKVRFLEETKVFDFYQGDPIPAGKKSLAFRMKFQSPDRSLTDEEVNMLYEKVLSHLTNKIDVELRK